MKTIFKRIIGLALSLILALGVFAGCSNNKSADQLAEIQQKGKIIVGVEGTYTPFCYHDPKTNELIGIDVELAKAIGDKLGVKVEFVEARWESLLSGVDSGRFDTVINNVGVTDERKEKYNFSDAYLYIPKQVVVSGDNDEIKGIDDLNGKKVATSATNAFNPWFESKGASVVAVDTSDEAASLLLSGRADFVNFDPLILKSYLAEHPDANLKVAFAIPDTYEATAIPVRKGETNLLNAIDKALDELSADGTLAKISEKYVDVDYTQKP